MSLIDNLTLKCFVSNRGDGSFNFDKDTYFHKDNYLPITTITTTTTTTTTGIFIVRVIKGYKFVMNVRILLINCNRSVNRTILFLILIYRWVG